MDSKNIYISYKHYFDSIEWCINKSTEWIYVGANDKLDRNKVLKLLNTFFEDDKLYLITDRHSSSLIEKSQAIEKVTETINEYNPTLTSIDFSKAMEFNKIGVLRKGERKD